MKNLDRDSVSILPDVLSFGCICQGFVYQLNVTISNKCGRPQYFRVICKSRESEQNIIKSIFTSRSVAPGLSISLILELKAVCAMKSVFELNVVGSDNLSITNKKEVSAFVVPLDVFKHVTKAWRLQKKNIYRHGVKPVSTTQPVEEISLISTGITSSHPPSIASVISEALMDNDDIDDLLELPMQPNLYWDPFEKCIRVDSELGKVLVEPSWSVEDSIGHTHAMWDKRYKELEEQGYYTIRTIERLAENRKMQLDSFSVVADDSQLQQQASQELQQQGALSQRPESTSLWNPRPHGKL